MSSMKTNRFLLVLIVVFIVYLLPEIFFGNAMLYLSGGIIGGTISEVFKGVSEGFDTFLVFLVWAILLLGLVGLFFYLKYKPVKYLLLLLIAFFLYIIDNLFAFIPYSGTTDPQKVALISNIVIGFLVISKSLILSLIIYFDGKRREEKAAA